MNPNRRIYIERVLLFVIAVAFTAAAVVGRWFVALDLQVYEKDSFRVGIEREPEKWIDRVRERQRERE